MRVKLYRARARVNNDNDLVDLQEINAPNLHSTAYNDLFPKKILNYDDISQNDDGVLYLHEDSEVSELGSSASFNNTVIANESEDAKSIGSLDTDSVFLSGEIDVGINKFDAKFDDADSGLENLLEWERQIALSKSSRKLTVSSAQGDIPITDDTEVLLKNVSSLGAKMALCTKREFSILLERFYKNTALRIASSLIKVKFPIWNVSSINLNVIAVSIVCVAVVIASFYFLFGISAVSNVILIYLSFYSLMRCSILWRFCDEAKKEAENSVDDLSLEGSDEPDAEADLPTYAVLVPLYKEASMVHQCVESISAIDYPADKISVYILLEQDDDETYQAIQAINLPEHFQVLKVPRGYPRTKPKAMNFAMQFVNEEFVCVFDAEDRPDKNQLLLAARKFQKFTDMAVLQARLVLRCVNKRCEPASNFMKLITLPNRLIVGWLEKMACLDYYLHFWVVMPAWQRLGWAFPLAGTSNHFRVSCLREIGYWDSRNVTEDADLGIRLSRLGYKISIIESVTYGTPPHSIYFFITQRTRWQKGWLQTYFVHYDKPYFWRLLLPSMSWFYKQKTPFQKVQNSSVAGDNIFEKIEKRNPVDKNSILSTKSTLHFVCSAVPIMAVGTLLVLVSLGGIISGNSSYLSYFSSNLGASFSLSWLIVLLSVLVVHYRMIILARRLSIKSAEVFPVGFSTLTLPLYWIFIGLIFWRVLYQLYVNPSLWEKTDHLPE